MNGYMILFLALIGITFWSTLAFGSMWLLAHVFNVNGVNRRLRIWAWRSLTCFALSVLMFVLFSVMEKM